MAHVEKERPSAFWWRCDTVLQPGLYCLVPTDVSVLELTASLEMGKGLESWVDKDLRICSNVLAFPGSAGENHDEPGLIRPSTTTQSRAQTTVWRLRTNEQRGVLV